MPRSSTPLLLTLAALACAGTASRGARHAGQEFDDCGGAAWCPRMVVIPTGTFTMGTPADEPGYDPIEGPQHEVAVRQFAAAKFPVTRRQWAAFVAATRRPTHVGCSWTGRSENGLDTLGSWQSLGFEQTDDDPVVCVSWQDAEDYLRWVTRRTGHEYRLLTESEWEYAARAGEAGSYPWGAAADHAYANYGSDECCGGRADGRDRWLYTSPVGSFPANAFGLFDMHGNVLEWVQDCLAPSYAGLPADGSAYQIDTVLHLTGDLSSLNGSRSCAHHMLRGGDWADPPVLIRSGFRSFAPPPGEPLGEYRSGGAGLRVARSLPPSPLP